MTYTPDRCLHGSHPDTCGTCDEERQAATEAEARTPCPDCAGTGKRRIPLEDPWGDIEEWVERTCSFCGGVGDFDAMQASEMAAEIHAAGGRWYE